MGIYPESDEKELNKFKELFILCNTPGVDIDIYLKTMIDWLDWLTDKLASQTRPVYRNWKNML